MTGKRQDKILKLAKELVNPDNTSQMQALVAAGYSESTIKQRKNRLIEAAMETPLYKREYQKLDIRNKLSIEEFRDKLLTIADDTENKISDRLAALKMYGQTIGAFDHQPDSAGNPAFYGFAKILAERSRHIENADVVE